MRLIEDSITKSLFESLTNDDVNRAINDAFDGTDFVITNIDSDDDYNVTVGIVAYDGEGNELTRDIKFEFDKTDYDSVYNICDEWISSHQSVDSFNEGVTISTGSTVVTSDETGVTIEDNGNNITTGNGVSVTIDNESDVLPDEMDVAEPVEEPVDDIEVSDEVIEEPTEEVSDEEIDEPIEDEDIVEESAVNEEVLEEPTEETEEEINNSKIEEADGVLSQNVEIFQNPEFDYSIKDITELDNVDTGDVRAIDMQNILIGLDEALTERFGTENWGTLNSFITRKGKHKKTNESYSSAILELSLPNNYNKVLMLEVYGDKLLKECVVRDSRSKVITRLCGKSANPINHFESVILDIINNKKLNEDIQFMVNEPEREENINFADSKDVDKDKEVQEKRLEDKEKSIKDKFKVEKEPDQENTAGEKIANSTDTAEVEEPEKVKKEKVDVEKIKVKEIKESEELNEMGNFAGRMDTLRAAGDRETIYRNDIVNQKNNKIKELFSRLKEIQDDVEELKEIGRHVKLYNLKDRYGIWLDASGRGLDYENSEEPKETLLVDTDKILMAEPYLETSEVTVEKLTEPNPFHHKNVFIKLATEMLDNYPSYIKAVNQMIDDYDLKYPVKSQEGVSESIKLKKNNKLKEAEEIIDEEPIESEISDEDTEIEETVTSTAIFHKTPSTTDQMKKQEDAGITTNQAEYTIYETVELSDEEFNDFKNNLQGEYDFLKSTDTSTSDSYKCIEVKNKDTGEALLIDTNGTGKARYVAFEDVMIDNEESTDEPIKDTEISDEEAVENILDEPIEDEE